jgi:hypothetical protein
MVAGVVHINGCRGGAYKWLQGWCIPPLGKDNVPVSVCALELLHKRMAKVHVRGVDAGDLEHSRHDVKELHRLSDHVTLPAARGANEERHTREHVLQPAWPLLDETVIARVIAMVGEDGDRRGVCEARLVERGE